jgi:hypothetical protein
MSSVTWEDLEGENALVVVGIVHRLLRKVEREVGGSLKGLAGRYQDEALAGDYEHLMDVSHRYAREHLRTTLEVPEERD